MYDATISPYQSKSNKNVYKLSNNTKNKSHLETKKISGFRCFEGVEVELPELERLYALVADFDAVSSLIRLRVASIASGITSWTALLCNAFIATEAASLTSFELRGANKQ